MRVSKSFMIILCIGAIGGFLGYLVQADQGKSGPASLPVISQGAASLARHDSVMASRIMEQTDSMRAARLISRHEYWIGMDSGQLRQSIGKPNDVDLIVTVEDTVEQWAYHEMVTPPKHDPLVWGDLLEPKKKVWSGRSKYFYFVNGVLTTYQDYK